MPRVRVEWLTGRTHEQRRRLVELLTNAVVEVARVEPDAVSIVFVETPRELQAKGGVLWSEMTEAEP